PPRTATEMAEWLRRLGDVAATELEGAMAGLLHELAVEGRVERIVLPAVAEPGRWVLVEEADRYRAVFGPDAPPGDAAQPAGAAILRRYLATRALVGLEDILRRYPFEQTWAQRQLEEWARTGQLVPVQATEAPEPLQWSLPENLDQARRGTLAILRREV